jgi:hypothetical protein
MTTNDYRQAKDALPDAGTSELCRSLHTALSLAWADNPEADADQLLDHALESIPAAQRDQAAPMLRRAQLDLIERQLRKRALPILYH